MRLRYPVFSLTFVLILVSTYPGHAVTGNDPVVSKSHASITINGDSQFTAANGVTSGRGTRLDPYLIEGWIFTPNCVHPRDCQGSISISDTTAYFVIRNVTASAAGPSTAVLFYRIVHGEISNSSITGGEETLTVLSSRLVKIDSNTIGAPRGITVESSTEMTISNNQLFSGILVSNSNQTFINGNVARNSDAGIVVSASNTTIVAQNNVSNNSFTGILVGGSHDITVSENNVTANGFSNCVPERPQCHSGIALVNSTNTQLYHNNIIRNKIQAYDQGGSGNVWASAYPSGGNYWSNYTGVDHCSGPSQDDCTKSDGIGDTPYVFSSNKDQYPLMNPFTANDNGQQNGSPPVVTITGLSPEPARPGQTVTLNFTASDPDGIIEMVQVDWGDDSAPDLLVNMTSPSMCLPTNCILPTGAFLVIKNQDPSTIRNQSIIAFTPYYFVPDYLVVHRVIQVIPPTDAQNHCGEYVFITKGDANMARDIWPDSGCQPNWAYGVTASELVGVYQSMLRFKGPPGTGYYTHVYSTPSSLPFTNTIRVSATAISPTVISTGSASQAITLVGPKTNTVVAVSCNDSSIQIGNFTMCTVTVTGSSPSGPVTFSTSSKTGSFSPPNGNCTLNRGKCSVQYTDTASSNALAILASYGGDDYNTAGSGNFHLNVLGSPVRAVSTILGVAPIMFYGIAGAAITAGVVAGFIGLRTRKPQVS